MEDNENSNNHLWKNCALTTDNVGEMEVAGVLDLVRW